MSKKLRSTLSLVGLLLLIVIVSGVYVFVFQRAKLNQKKNKLEELRANNYNTDQLTHQYKDLLKRSNVLDSILAARKFNIPKNLSQIKFYDFINNVSASYSPNTQIDVEFLSRSQDKDFFYYEYKLTGKAPYNDIYNLVYAIEHSKELKKITNIALNNLVVTDDDGIPNFLVGFTINVGVYFSNNDRFATAKLVENNLRTSEAYDAFYPQIRNQIPPNIDNLLDVQGAKLLALIPEGAFVADNKGNTYLVYEGEQVYLGYLTKIDYDKNTVNFILNKGGIIEKVQLALEKEKTKDK
jgi:hypothetical protein